MAVSWEGKKIPLCLGDFRTEGGWWRWMCWNMWGCFPSLTLTEIIQSSAFHISVHPYSCLLLPSQNKPNSNSNFNQNYLQKGCLKKERKEISNQNFQAFTKYHDSKRSKPQAVSEKDGWECFHFTLFAVWFPETLTLLRWEVFLRKLWPILNRQV